MQLWLIVGLFLSIGLLVSPPAQAAPEKLGLFENCNFVLGFATIHDLIPDRVGQCRENEHYNPVNGDAIQMTEGGLLAWRKSDNWTAFTDGFRSWVNGPFGLQRRLNSQRFAWEQNPDRLAIVPPPIAGERCHTAGLSLGLIGTDAGAGNVVATFRFTNNLTVPCTFYGYPGARLLDSDGYPLPTRVVRGGGFMANQPGPATINVPAGGSAIFRMHWGQVEVGSETSCPEARSIMVTPPDEYTSLEVPMTIRACGGGTINVSAIQSGG